MTMPAPTYPTRAVDVPDGAVVLDLSTEMVLKSGEGAVELPWAPLLDDGAYLLVSKGRAYGVVEFAGAPATARTYKVVSQFPEGLLTTVPADSAPGVHAGVSVVLPARELSVAVERREEKGKNKDKYSVTKDIRVREADRVVALVATDESVGDERLFDVEELDGVPDDLEAASDEDSFHYGLDVGGEARVAFKPDGDFDAIGHAAFITEMQKFPRATVSRFIGFSGDRPIYRELAAFEYEKGVELPTEDDPEAEFRRILESLGKAATTHVELEKRNVQLQKFGGEGGVHAHTLHRSGLTTAQDGLHGHIFEINGDLVFTALDGAHEHGLASEDANVSEAGVSAHRHIVFLMDGKATTEADGEHMHQLQVEDTANDGLHTHELVIGDRTFVSLTPGEFWSLFNNRRAADAAKSDPWPEPADGALFPYVLSDEAVLKHALPPEGSGLPESIEAEVPVPLRYWLETDRETALAKRAALVASQIFTADNIQLVDGAPRRVVTKQFVGEPIVYEPLPLDALQHACQLLPPADVNTLVLDERGGNGDLETSLAKGLEYEGDFILAAADTLANRYQLSAAGDLFTIPGRPGVLFASSCAVDKATHIEVERWEPGDGEGTALVEKPFPNEHAARQKPPGNFVRFRRTHPKGFPAAIDAIIGFKSGGGSEIQSLRAKSAQMTVGEFRAWLKDHGFKSRIEPATNKGKAKKAAREAHAILTEDGQLAVGPVTKVEARAWKTVVKVDGPDATCMYVPVGTAPEMAVAAEPGDVVKVSFETMAARLSTRGQSLEIKTPTVLAKVDAAVTTLPQALALARPEEVAQVVHERQVQFIKRDAPDAEERFVLGIVLEPDTVDAQDDIYDAGEVRAAAHHFMEHHGDMKLMHKGEAINDKVAILESFIAPVDFEANGQKVRKGTWLLAVRMIDDDLWIACKEGRLTGFSIGGTAIREPRT